MKSILERIEATPKAGEQTGGRGRFLKNTSVTTWQAGFNGDTESLRLTHEASRPQSRLAKRLVKSSVIVNLIHTGHFERPGWESRHYRLVFMAGRLCTLEQHDEVGHNSRWDGQDIERFPADAKPHGFAAENPSLTPVAVMAVIDQLLEKLTPAQLTKPDELAGTG